MVNACRLRQARMLPVGESMYRSEVKVLFTQGRHSDASRTNVQMERTNVVMEAVWKGEELIYISSCEVSVSFGRHWR